jgi:hypothetical protein
VKIQLLIHISNNIWKLGNRLNASPDLLQWVMMDLKWAHWQSNLLQTFSQISRTIARNVVCQYHELYTYSANHVAMLMCPEP